MQSDKEDSEIISPKPELSFGKRSLVVWATWLVALFAACPTLEGVELIPLFPIGLAIVLHLEGLDEHHPVVAIVGWLGYLFFKHFRA